jgi:hypothetical protein
LSDAFGGFLFSCGGVWSQTKMCKMVPKKLKRLLCLGQSEPAPTNAPVGGSVHGMGCILSSGVNQSTFFWFLTNNFFWGLVFFSTLTFILLSHLVTLLT